MKITNILLYFLVFVIIYITDDSFMFGTIDNYGFILTKILIYCSLIILLFIRHKKYTISSSVILLLLICVIFFTAIFNYDFSSGYMYQIIIILLSFLLVKEINFSTFKFLFTKYIYILSLISLVLYILVIFFPSILNYFPIMNNFGGERIYNLFLCAIYEGDGSSLLRNTSIYREPGVYMIYLNIAILFSLFSNSKLNKKYILIFFLAIISTMSTAGILISGSMILLSFFQKRNDYSTREKNSITVLFVFFIFFFILNNVVYEKIFGKLNSSSSSYGSTLARTASLLVPIRIFFDNPIFGAGLDSFSSEFQNYSTIYFGFPFSSGGTATNTFTNKFATYGFLYGAIFIYSFLRFSKIISNNPGKIKRFIFFLIMFAMFSNEDLRNSLLFNMIFFYGLSATIIIENRQNLGREVNFHKTSLN